VTNPKSGIEKEADLKGKTFAFGDKGSTSGYLIPFSKVIYTKHQAIETQVTRGELDAGADYNRNRNAMIEQGLIKSDESKIIWQSEPLPNDAFALSEEIAKDKKVVSEIKKALKDIATELKNNPAILPAHYTGFVEKTNSFYKPIRDAGLAIGKLTPKQKS